MKKLIVIIFSMIFLIEASSIYASDLKIPIKQSTVNSFLSALKPKFAQKLKEALGSDLTRRGTEVEYVTLDFKSNNIELRTKMKAKSTYDWPWPFGSTDYTIYFKTKTSIDFHIVYNQSQNRFETDITDIDVDKLRIWSSNFIINIVASWFNILSVICFDMIGIDGIIADKILTAWLPPLTIDLPQNAQLLFNEITYHSTLDAYMVGLNYLSPLSLSIEGPTNIEFPSGIEYKEVTWTALANGGSGSYDYSWFIRMWDSETWQSLGNSVSQTITVESNDRSFELKCILNDGISEVVKIMNIVLTHCAGGADYSIENFPNPFNPETKIKFNLPNNSFVNLTVYDNTGRKVEDLVNNNLKQGKHIYTFNASNLASGIYYYRISAGPFTKIKRMLVIK